MQDLKNLLKESEGGLTLGSLFDGSGGFPLAGLLNGIRPVWASDIEPFPIAVVHKRMPFVRHYGDICRLNGSELEPVDIITFGSPCQDLSIAGCRVGIKGQRSSLLYEAVRIIKEMRSATGNKYPRYAVWENVVGAFSSNNGEDFRSVLESLCGVTGDECHVPVPPGGGGSTQEAFWETGSQPVGGCLTLNTSESPRDATECTLSQILIQNVPAKFYLSPKACAGILRRTASREKYLPERLKQALIKQSSMKTANVLHEK